MLRWLLKRLGFGERGLSIEELARRLDVPVDELNSIEPQYRQFQIRKRSGRGFREIHAPSDPLKRLQRRILRRVLAKLNTHPAATAFKRHESFVTNAARHRSRDVVIRIDLIDFFPSIEAERVIRFFRTIGWSRTAAERLTELICHEDRLPQGAPTSPCISNLVCRALDSRMTRFLSRHDAVYTRYADDLTISLNDPPEDLHGLIAGILAIIRSEGFRPHVSRKKFDVRRPHQRQKVTGLVVNNGVNLPRETRRWLRAVAHRAKAHWIPLHEQTGAGTRLIKAPTITEQQFHGWLGLIEMIRKQREEWLKKESRSGAE